jgi:hypothetical protein
MLLHYVEGDYFPIDPVKTPEQVNTRFAYLTYCDTPATIKVTGIPNTNIVRSLALAGGWNLAGCPSQKPMTLQTMGVVRKSMTARLADRASSANKDNNKSWLYSIAYSYDTKCEKVNLLDPEAMLQPTRGLWIFAWHPVMLVLKGRSENTTGPYINSLDPSTVPAGQSLSVKGSCFGAQPGEVAIAGIPVKDDYLLSWSDSVIELRVPSYCMPGDVVVFAGRSSSNSLPLKLAPAEPTATVSTLIGRVQTSSGSPLKGALIVLDKGLSTTSGSDGAFTISQAPSGEHLLDCSFIGYRGAEGKVHLPPGGSDAVNITLTPIRDLVSPAAGGNTSPPPVNTHAPEGGTTPKKPQEPRKGTLHVVADAYDDGYHRWWVCKIDVAEWGNSNYHWYNDWYSDMGDAYYLLDCPGARVGQTYIITVYYASKDGGNRLSNSWYRKMYSTYQTETIDSPETLVH